MGGASPYHQRDQDGGHTDGCHLGLGRGGVHALLSSACLQQRKLDAALSLDGFPHTMTLLLIFQFNEVDDPAQYVHTALPCTAEGSANVPLEC